MLTFAFMNRLKFLVAFTFAFCHGTFAHIPKISDEVEDFIYEISRDMGSHFVYVADKVDSLRATLSDEELEDYRFMFDYTDAFVAYVKSDFDKTVNYSMRALEHFLYNDQEEWAARCLLLIGNVSSARQLVPEAIKTYRLVIKYSEDAYTLSSAHLNLAKNLNSANRDWHESLRLGKYYSELTGDEGLILQSHTVSYWLNPDSAAMVDDIPLIAERFSEIGHYSQVADAYKCLVMYYFRKGDFTIALKYANMSIDAYSLERTPPKILLSSIYYLKALILMDLDIFDEAFSAIVKAININKDANYLGGNYNLYITLYHHEYDNENYKQACFYLKIANGSLRCLTNDKIEYSYKMAAIFNNIDIIEEELEVIKRASVRRIVLISLLLILFFLSIIFWLTSKKRHYEKRSEDMEGRNEVLQKETGELLIKVGQNSQKDKMHTTHDELEKQMDKYLIPNSNLPEGLKERFAETLLCFEVKLDMLSQTEKRYAVMIVLEVPYKMIAEIFNVQPRTVAQYRNRIRKKMGISNTDIDLEKHLKTFLDS